MSNTTQSFGPTSPGDDESCHFDGMKLIRGVHERWNRDLGGVRGSGSWSKDTGVLSTDVSVSEHNEDEDTEKGT